MRSTPARAQAAVETAERAWATTGTPRAWAVSQASRSSSSVHTRISPDWRGTSPVEWILIQSTPTLTWRRISATSSAWSWTMQA
jgi:hypothetical protein